MLRDAVRERIEREHAAASRQKIKRALLDQLDAQHKFEPPPTLVEQEFSGVWTTIENDLKQHGRSFADEGTTEEKALLARRIAVDRRAAGAARSRHCVKSSNNHDQGNGRPAHPSRGRAIEISSARAAQQVWDYYRNNPGALAVFGSAPLFEDKVVDLLVELADVTDKAGFCGKNSSKDDEDECRLAIAIASFARPYASGAAFPRIPAIAACR